jgi:hypothetical protein
MPGLPELRTYVGGLAGEALVESVDLALALGACR